MMPTLYTDTVHPRDEFLAIANPAAYEAARVQYGLVQKIAYVKNATCNLCVSDIFMLMFDAGYRSTRAAPFNVEPVTRIRYGGTITVQNLRAVRTDAPAGSYSFIGSQAYGVNAA